MSASITTIQKAIEELVANGFHKPAEVFCHETTAKSIEEQIKRMQTLYPSEGATEVLGVKIHYRSWVKPGELWIVPSESVIKSPARYSTFLRGYKDYE